MGTVERVYRRLCDFSDVVSYYFFGHIPLNGVAAESNIVMTGTAPHAGNAEKKTMKKLILLLAVLLLGTPLMWAQENTFRITVLSYQWTTTHRTLTFSWPGYANTSCNGNMNMDAYVSGGGNISASGTSSDTCSTTYTPPSDQSIDVQKPVVYILANSESSRMVLTCTRNVRWSQCHALNPGSFLARNDKGHFEVQGLLGKGKEEWIRFDVVQQTALSQQKPQTASLQAAPVSIEAPKSDAPNANSGFPSRWKSMTTGKVHTLRFAGEYIYAELEVSEAAAKAGVFALTEVKKDGDKYVGKTNSRALKTQTGPSCSLSWPIEFTLVTPDRIEGRGFTPPVDHKFDWNTCTSSPPADWQPFVWIPVK